MSTNPQTGGSYRADPKTGEPVLVERTQAARHVSAHKPDASRPEAAHGKKRAEDKE